MEIYKHKNKDICVGKDFFIGNIDKPLRLIRLK